MSKRFKVWLDSGANNDSRREQEFSLDDIGLSDDEWERMTPDEKESEMREVAFDHSDWGFAEIDA